MGERMKLNLKGMSVSSQLQYEANVRPEAKGYYPLHMPVLAIPEHDLVEVYVATNYHGMLKDVSRTAPAPGQLFRADHFPGEFRCIEVEHGGGDLLLCTWEWRAQLGAGERLPAVEEVELHPA